MKGPSIASGRGTVRLSKRPSAGQRDLHSDKKGPSSVMGPTVAQNGPSVGYRANCRSKWALRLSEGVLCRTDEPSVGQRYFLGQRALHRFIEALRLSEGAIYLRPGGGEGEGSL